MDLEAHPGNLYRRAKINLRELSNRHPSQFPIGPYQLRWPDGWHTIMRDLCQLVDDLALDTYWIAAREDGGVFQLVTMGMSPYAGMRLRGLQGPDPVGEAHRKSCVTCARCGGPGTLQRTGWVMTLCDACTPKVIAWNRARGDAPGCSK